MIHANKNNSTTSVNTSALYTLNSTLVVEKFKLTK